MKTCTLAAFKLNEFKSVHIYLQGGVREHGDFPQAHHFLVNGVDHTPTSEGTGKGWAHAQWGGGGAEP